MKMKLDNENITPSPGSPQGHYCLEGTYPSTEKPCPEGTYRATPGARSEDECSPCSGGMACTTVGLTNPDKGRIFVFASSSSDSFSLDIMGMSAS